LCYEKTPDLDVSSRKRFGKTDGVADFKIEMEAFSYGNDIHIKKQ
jgi:hypothetical protein